jgi:sulfide:quinone oxidoreductase
VARVDVMFVSGQAPNGSFDAPSHAVAADKEEFGSSRVQRWFGREWTNVGAPA